MLYVFRMRIPKFEDAMLSICFIEIQAAVCSVNERSW